MCIQSYIKAFIGAFALLTAMPALAHESSKSFVIGVEDLEYYPLWRYDKTAGGYVGLGRLLLDAFAADKGYRFEYKAYPVKRLVRELVEQRVDFKFPDNPYWAQEAKGKAAIVYSKPAIHYIDGVFVKPERQGGGDVSIKILGSVLGFTPWDWLKAIEAGTVKLKENPNLEALIAQALTGHIDGAYVNSDVMHYQLKASGRKGLLVFDESLSHIKGEYLLSTIKHPEVVAEFNEWLNTHAEQIAAMRATFGM